MSDDNNIVPFSGATTLDIDTDKVLKAAVGKLDGVMVIGDTKDGGLYLASSTGDAGDLLIWLRLAEKYLLEIMSGD